MTLSSRLGQLEKDSPAPLYFQLQRMLRIAIVNGELQEQDVLPAERDLAAEFGVSRVTVRNAIEGLVSEGLLSRRRGAGTFVGSAFDRNFSKLTSFSEDMISRGRKPSSECLLRAQGHAKPEESLALGLSPGSSVYRFERVRFADTDIMAFEQTTIPAYSLPSPEALEDSLYTALQLHGHRPVRALQRLRVIYLDADQAGRLGVEPGAAGLLIERRGFLHDGRAVEFTRSYYRGDTFDIVAELNI